MTRRGFFLAIAALAGIGGLFAARKRMAVPTISIPLISVPARFYERKSKWLS